MRKYISILFLAVFVQNVVAQNIQLENKIYDNFDRLYIKGKYIDAKIIGDSIVKRLKDKKTLDYALFLDQYSECLYELEEYDSALLVIEKALKIKNEICGKNSVEYAKTLHQKSTCLDYMGSKKASSVEKKAFQIIKQNEIENSPIYMDFFLEYIFYSNPNYSEVFNLLHKIDSNSLTYVKALSLLSSLNFDEGKYKNSIELLNEAISVLEKNEKQNHPLYANHLNDLGHCFYKLGDYFKAFDLYKESNRIYKESLGINSINYIYTLTSMAHAKAMMGEFGYAKHILDKVSKYARFKYGEYSEEYATILQIYALIESKSYNYATAVRCQKEANQILKKTYGKYDKDYLLGLSLIASSLGNQGEYSEGEKYAQELLSLSKKQYGKNSPMYAYALGHLGTLKEGNERLDLLLKSLKIYSSLEGEYKLDIAEGLRALSVYYDYFDICHEKSIAYQTKALSIYESVEGKESVRYITSLGELAHSYYLSGNIKKSISCYENYFLLKKRLLSNNLLSLDRYDKFSYLDNYDETLNKSMLKTCFDGKELEKARELAFDITLFKKSVLLSSELYIRNVLRNSDSLSTLNRFQIVEPMESNTNKNKLFSVEGYKDTLELNTIKNKMLINWRDIQSVLSEHDIAIEFEIIPIDDKQKLYCALALKKEYNTPKIIPLFNSEQLFNIPNEKYYHTKDLSHLIWEPLSKELIDVQNIYFAPVGQFYNISIEYLPHYNREGIMSDYYNICRLSSTRNLVNKHKKITINNIAIYGGLYYDSKSVSLYNQSFERNNNDNFITYLPNTKIETDSIESIFKCNSSVEKKEVFKYDGLKGTEESFKSLNNKHINIIHLSTHGFCRINSKRNFESYINEDQILTLSGVYMSGVNDIKIEEKDLEDYNNGLLTSYEISNLDFKDLDLVVLSACQTGMGLLHHDGVFGLQRAFIKAGANSLLMSLWNVDDYATRLFMIEFYRSYINGNSKIQSLLKAQRFIKEYKDDDGIRIFEDPYYWAGFILLDALI